MELHIDSWWGKMPSKCSCGMKVSVKVLDPQTRTFHCRKHGLVIEAHREMKRGGTEDWRFYRIFRDYFQPPTDKPEQMSLMSLM